MSSFELIVIGAGPGGYVAAIKAAQLGFKTALVEKDPYLGGTCLNIGCIPSKALLHSTEVYHAAAHGASQGITGGDKLSVDVAAMLKNKQSVTERLRSGVNALVTKRGITIIQGTATLADNKSIKVAKPDGTVETLDAKHIIIASGSVPVELPFMKFDGKQVVSSTDALNFGSVPARLVIVGAGAIGLELGSVWSRLGSKVTIVEMLPTIGGPGFDQDSSKVAERAFKKQGLDFELQTKVTGVRQDKKEVVLLAEKNGKPVEFPADKILVAVGRRANTSTLGAVEAGLKLDDRGRVIVDDHFHANLPGVYAIGDAIAGPMLAHKAEEEAIACVEMIAGKAGHVNYDVIPGVVYTEPELANVGLSETDAKAKGYEVKIGKFNIMANGRAIASNATDGAVKIVADAKTDRLLGAQIICHNASEMISTIVAHLEYGGSAEDIARSCFAHPTIGESIKEAAMAVDKMSIHSL
ncbi:MAG: dihydrolipoyl dehydrogenase [Puniceicoccales bacterium]|jgi:dihydrolipoamide dehydrogenase|nr:dihydrolipoyl dehydrogenase [Puniceicoccales bacterium]